MLGKYKINISLHKVHYKSQKYFRKICWQFFKSKITDKSMFSIVNQVLIVCQHPNLETLTQIITELKSLE